MNPLIRLERATRLFIILVLIACPEISTTTQAGSPSGQDHLSSKRVERQNAPVSLGGGGWNVVPSPNTGSPHNYFYGLAAIASDDVWAVGGYGNLTTQAQQLIQHWNGQNWIVVPTPALPTTYNELLAISAVSANDAWAVGSSGGNALIERWDGSSWSVVSNPNPGTLNRFFGVSAISTNNVWAVGVTSDGGLSQTLVEHWNGTSWSVIPSPNIPDQHNQLNAVTAIPGAPNELWAVGEAGPSALILHWNGTQWSIVPSPTAGIVPKLKSVVAISANDVWAVGWTGGKSGPITLIEHWDGSTWSVVPSPNPSATDNFLSGVTGLAPNSVWAVGEFNEGGNQRTLFLRWNGTAWEQVPGENTGPNGAQFFLSAVSAIGGNDIWAVGNNSHTLAEHWNGSSWSMVSTPNAGVGENTLNGVSGSASNEVWQVGYYAFGTWKQTLIERWNGTDWSLVPSPNTNNRLNELNGVAAISASNAWAVGNAHSGQAPANQATLVLRWDGTAWSIIPSPSPGSAGLNTLYAVDANSANDVWAVGSYANIGGFFQTLVLHWDGTSWGVISSPNVAGANNELYGVVALSPSNVWAVGYWGHSSFGFSTLIEHWDGNSWSIVASPNPSGDNFLSAASATGPNDVWAVGRSRNPLTLMTTTLIEHWDGNSWSQVLGFGVEPSSAGYGVAAVSPGDAWGVGDGGGLGLIGRWNGSTWTVFPSPNVTGRLLATTAITPCNVWSVGLRYEEGVGFLTLSEHFISEACGTPSPTPTGTPTATPSVTPSPSPTATRNPTPRPRPTPRRRPIFDS